MLLPDYLIPWGKIGVSIKIREPLTGHMVIFPIMFVGYLIQVLSATMRVLVLGLALERV